MLSNAEKAEVADALYIMFKAYRTSDVAPETAVLYVEEVAEFSKTAIMEAIVAFRRGLVPDRNNAFSPSVPEFVTEVRTRNERMDVEAMLAATTFVVADSAKWRAICELRRRSMPRIERKGITGWYVPIDEVEAVPRQLIEKYQSVLDNPMPLKLPVPRLPSA